MTSNANQERRDSTFSVNMRKISDSLKWHHLTRKSVVEKELPGCSLPPADESDTHRVQSSLTYSRRRLSHTQTEAVGPKQQYWDPESLQKVADDQIFFESEKAAEVSRTDNSSRGPFELEDTQKLPDLPVEPHEHGQHFSRQRYTTEFEDVLNSISSVENSISRPTINRKPTPIPQPFYQEGVATSRSSSSSSTSTSDASTITATIQSTRTPYSSISSAPPSFPEKCYKRNSFHAANTDTAVPEIKRQASARLAKGLVPSKDLDSWSWLWDEAFDVKNKINPDRERWGSDSRRSGLEYQVQHKCGNGSGLVTSVFPNGTIVSSSPSQNSGAGLTEEQKKRQADAAAGRRKSFVERWVLGIKETPHPGPLLPNMTSSDASKSVAASADSTSPVSSTPSLTSAVTVETPLSSAATSPDHLSEDTTDSNLDLADTSYVIPFEDAGLSSFVDCVSAIQVAPPPKRVGAPSFASASSTNLRSTSSNSTPRSVSPVSVVPAKDVLGEAWDRRDICQDHKNCHSLHRRYVRADTPENDSQGSAKKSKKKSGFGQKVESLLRH